METTREQRIAQMMTQMGCSQATAERTLAAMEARRAKTADEWAETLEAKKS